MIFLRYGDEPLFLSPNFQIDNIVKNKKKSSQKWNF